MGSQESYKPKKRKFSGLPYIVHPEAVDEIISNITDDEDIIAAAWLHDIVEDTDTTIDDVKSEFNKRIAKLVSEVTKVSKKGKSSRTERFWKDVCHYEKASKWGEIYKIS